MKLFLVTSFVVLPLVVAVLVLRSQPRLVEFSAAAMPSLVELHVMAGVHRLPDEEIDDQALVFSAKAKQ
ncbi:hypothetical protein [Bradyrhizobium cosmicum]|uniref:hypothetical protein n=1 Tax=Bradyrhizobium cosmicum TaxID=1404864 RepID=UPI0005A179A6|nr:hypothetical protein [Bradyrhizobium cosmicum]